MLPAAWYKSLEGSFLKDEDEELRSDFLLFKMEKISGLSRSPKKKYRQGSKVPVDRKNCYLLGEIESSQIF